MLAEAQKTLNSLTLNCLSPGQTGVVSSIQTSQRELKFKALALGLVPGTPVRVVSVAPLGDPITIEVRGTRICFRKAEASAIHLSQVTLVRKIEESPISLSR